jgi:rubrerythrin
MPAGILAATSDMAIGTVDEMLAIADAMERAAVRRYTMLGACMRQVGHDEVAAVFDSLAAEEQAHVESVKHLAQSKHVALPTPDGGRRALPDTFDLAEAGPAAMLTPYRALSAAVRGEERAFAFWAYVASEASSETLRVQAEAMARQELVHAAKLRHARRLAYHAEHPRGRPVKETDLPPLPDLATLRRQCAPLEAEVVEFLLTASSRLAAMSDAETAQLLRLTAETLRADAAGAPLNSNDRAALGRRLERAAALGHVGILFEAAGALELLAERYQDMLRTSASAAVTEALQALGDRTTRQVAALNLQLYAIEPNLASIVTGPEARQAPGRG